MLVFEVFFILFSFGSKIIDNSAVVVFKNISSELKQCKTNLKLYENDTGNLNGQITLLKNEIDSLIGLQDIEKEKSNAVEVRLRLTLVETFEISNFEISIETIERSTWHSRRQIPGTAKPFDRKGEDDSRL
jgi:hypothetical protein